MKSSTIVEQVIDSILNEYSDDFSEIIDNKPISELIREKLITAYHSSNEMPDELDAWEIYEDTILSYREEELRRVARLIEDSDYGLEFCNKSQTQFGVMLSCMSGKRFKVALFDKRGVFTHKSADTSLEIAKYLREYFITESNPDQKFEILSEECGFIKNTADLMDINKRNMFK